jgi:hypothetical protein
MIRIKLLLSQLSFIFCGTALKAAPPWQPVEGHLLTCWAEEVNPDNPWPEYPRPKMQRPDWLNLNGLWDYAIRSQEIPYDQIMPDLSAGGDGQILVPFCAESALSGVGKRIRREGSLWYRRHFEIPTAWQAKNHDLLLHFGAVDWECTVWVNGNTVGSHQGGYDPFYFNISAFVQKGENEIMIRVWDPTSDGTQPRGKQLRNPDGIWYTPVTGIWQTVWLEPVPRIHIERLQCVPDIDTETLKLTVHLSEASETEVWVRALDGEKEVARAKGIGGQTMVLPIPNPKLWSPEDPFLYDLEVMIKDGDKVKSYFGMRKISMTKDGDGIPRIALNNQILFQYGPLDQGWWPDGLYTPANETALLYDIEITKKLGMNMIRKHVKVEMERFYYHCDRLGMLVWQDMPNGNCETDPEGQQQFRVELERMITAFEHYPSIVMWVPFNEAWGQHDTVATAEWVKKRDPSRLINEASGWKDHGAGDIKDLHIYTGPGMPDMESYRAGVMGEFGGLGYAVKGHLWSETKGAKNWGYGDTHPTPSHFQQHYDTLIHRMRPMIEKGLCAAVYTQTSDVEGEINGLMTYDRAVVKLDIEHSAALHAGLYDLTIPLPDITEVSNKPKEEEQEVIPLLPTSEQKAQTWKYTTEKPSVGWEKPTFRDRQWKSGKGMFGSKGTPAVNIGTEWSGSDIWMRRTFELDAIPRDVMLRLFHDEDVEVYINGKHVKSLHGYTVQFINVNLDEEGVLREGRNTIAVHCQQTSGGQGIDVGLVEIRNDVP